MMSFWSSVAAVAALFPASIMASPIPVAAAVKSIVSRGASSYHMYSGSGMAEDYWPSRSQWVETFDELYALNEPLLKISCSQWGVPNNSAEEIANIKSAIQSVSKSSGIDARFILVVMMQETKGCVRAPTTNNGVRNPGLFQCHNGEASCNDGSVLTPCPASMINKMVQEGVSGTGHGDGLAQLISDAGVSIQSGSSSDAISSYYRASRMYNSGSIDSSGNLGKGGATKCYASDIANRLLGWTEGDSECCLDEGCDVTAPTPNKNAITRTSSDSDKTASSTTDKTAASESSSAAVAKAVNKTGQSDKQATSTAAGKTATEKKGSKASGDCEKARVELGDTCESFADEHNLSTAAFMALNKDINSDCTNMYAGKFYCIA